MSPNRSDGNKEKANQSKTQSDYSELGGPKNDTSKQLKKRPTSAQIKPPVSEGFGPKMTLKEGIVMI